MLEFLIGLGISIILGILLMIVIIIATKEKTKKSTAVNSTPTKAAQTNTPSKSKSKFWSFFSTTIGLLILIVIMTVVIVFVLRAIVFVSPAVKTIRDTFNDLKIPEPSKPTVHQTTTTAYIAVKTGTKVLMKTPYWQLKPMGKIKVKAPNGTIFYDGPGVQNKTHFSEGWYIFYPVGNNEVTFYVTQ
jgi:cytoskeletal protein RodZ